ncbi:MAG: Si-specific NAD(P)(+) transhydrogenase [Candidatus Kapabacteria bacterium]|nr:Si-specific NAD(P)(+) transhydrogenase [Candidatus Kapabacteria bacterium]
MLDYDYVIIGSGPGGQKAAIQASKFGKKVVIIEKELKVGGHCVYKGTIPSKTFREAAIAIYRMKKYGNIFDFKLREDLEIQSLLTRLDSVLKAHFNFISEQLESNEIPVIHGRASFIDKNTIEVYKLDGSKEIITTEYVIISTGSSPRVPTDMYVDHEHILDSDSILNLIYLPQSLVILGAGVIACEYASAFALLGTKVTILDRAERPLTFMDKELTDRYVKEFESFGGTFKGNSKYKSVLFDGISKVKIELESGETIETEKVLFALGRVANLSKLKLENAGLEINDRNNLTVNKEYQTSVNNIYAVGDVIGFPSLASTSMEQGRLAVRNSLGMHSGHEFSNLPIGIYAVPEIACIGLNEEEAKAKYENIYVGRADFNEIARAQISGMTHGLLKLIADEELNLLGVHIIGENASDLIHVGELAILTNCKINIFLDNIMNFPTMAEAYRVAALNLLNQVV